MFTPFSYIFSNPTYLYHNIYRDNFLFFKKYKKLVFFDIVDFPHNFSKILETLKNYYDIEIILQIEDKDFNKDKIKIK